MKRIVRLLIAVLLVVGAASTSLADGGSPFPTCAPGKCPNGGGL